MRPVVVVDASVSIKWFVPSLPDEGDVPDALALLQAYASRQNRQNLGTPERRLI